MLDVECVMLSGGCRECAVECVMSSVGCRVCDVACVFQPLKPLIVKFLELASVKR